MKRKPLAIGNVYFYPFHPGSGFIVKHICFPGTDRYDGVTPGITIKWFGNFNGTYFFPCKSEKSFFSKNLFKTSVSK